MNEVVEELRHVAVRLRKLRIDHEVCNCDAIDDALKVVYERIEATSGAPATERDAAE